ncbi:MAG: hypothetical protein QW666_00425 [Candidatus Woesearchaeota archaeon]
MNHVGVDLIYEVLRIFGYINLQKEIDRVRAGLATPAEKHILFCKLRNMCHEPKQEYFKTNSEYEAAKLDYAARKKQLCELGHAPEDFSTAAKLEKIIKQQAK